MFDTDSDYANLWDNAATINSGNGGLSLPDGNYEVRVSSVRFDKTKNGSNIIAWDLVVTDGEYKGRHIFHNQSVASEKSIGFVKGQFARLGYDCSSFESVHKAFEDLLDSILVVTLKMGKATDKYEARQNCYFNKVVCKAAPTGGDTFDPSSWK